MEFDVGVGFGYVLWSDLAISLLSSKCGMKGDSVYFTRRKKSSRVGISSARLLGVTHTGDVSRK